jgi:hypothetical protein
VLIQQALSGAGAHQVQLSYPPDGVNCEIRCRLDVEPV